MQSPTTPVHNLAVGIVILLRLHLLFSDPARKIVILLTLFNFALM